MLSDISKNIQANLAKNAIKPMTIMEVCGTHTQAIFAHGIRSLLPANVRIVSGPGCPVCVTSQEDVEKMIWLSRQKNVVACTFGDMVRVPGNTGSLALSRSEGNDIRVFYSPFDVIDWAKQDPSREYVLIGVGFETTTPGFAATLKAANAQNIKNISHFSLHKTVPEALEALANMPQVNVDGLLLPGHVSAIIGEKPYRFVAEKYGIPGVISGFEGLDMMVALDELVKMIAEKKPEIKNLYQRIVREDGNPTARAVVAEVFEPSDPIWRGVGVIPGSGLKLRNEYLDFDAEQKFHMPAIDAPEPKGCLCGQVILGVVTPKECPLFAKVCTPSNPIGPCMVSGEGTCSAYYKYSR